MRNALGPGTVLGYCTNVHAGPTLARMRANLERHALAVKAKVCPDRPMAVGLWLAREAVAELVEHDGADELASWLDERGLVPFTLNGFPYADFHEPVVKHRVYEPDWTTEARTRFTLDLIRVHSRLLGEESEGSISTLPLGWRSRIGGTPGANNAVVSSSPCHTPGSPVALNEIFGSGSVTYNGGLQVPNYGVGSGNPTVSIDRWSEL